jgi:hypothetical protein
MPSQTRFAVNFLMISRVVECKSALIRVIMDETYVQFEASLDRRQNGDILSARARIARNDIHSESFWLECDNFLHMVEPVIIALRVFDGKAPAMPKAWLVMKTLQEHVWSLRNEPCFLNDETATKFEEHFEARWKLMLTDLHYARALLNPFLIEVGTLRSDGVAKRALNRVL